MLKDLIDTEYNHDNLHLTNDSVSHFDPSNIEYIIPISNINLENTNIIPENKDLEITHVKFPSTIRRIAIYNASFGTRELGPALLSSLRVVYNKPWYINQVSDLEYDREDILYIIICPAGLGPNVDKLPKYYINWQLEFLIGAYNVDWYINIMKKSLINWDYSRYNIEISKTRDKIHSIYVPPGFNETIASPDILNNTYLYDDQNKDIDVLFLGYCDAYPRRIHIRNEFNKTRYRTWFVSNLDLEGMKSAIRRSKVCINMASHDTFILAKVRINILLSNQACIVSETSVDKEADNLYSQNNILFANIDSIVPTVLYLLTNFKLRQEMAIKSYQWYRTHYNWNYIVDFNKLLPVISD